MPVLTRGQTVNRIVDTLRMTDRDLLRVLTIMDSRETPPSVAVRRRSMAPPAAADLPRMLIRLQDRSNNVWTTHLIKPRDMHRDGMRFLLGAFVHEGVRCVVLLRDHAGRPAQLMAVVTTCRHVHGRLHEVTIAFERPVRLQQYHFPDGTPIVANAQGSSA